MPKNQAGWEIISEDYYERFNIFSIKKSRRVNPRTGNHFDFFLIDGLDWVNVIPITPQGEIVLVKQYRHGAEAWTWEIPGGCVEKGEDPALSASRELLEETGYICERIESLGCLRPNPAMLSNNLHVYVGYGAKLVKSQKLDPGEDIKVALKSSADVDAMLGANEINHALVVAAFGLWNLNKLAKAKS